MQNPFSFDLDQSSVSQISFHTEDLEPQPEKPFDLPSVLPTSQELQSELNSQFIESLMICNDVDIEVELKKAKNTSEGVFKVLSMCFYDKSISSRPNGNNYSPLTMEQNMKTLTSRPSGNLAKAIEVKPIPISPANRPVSVNTVKLPNAETTKTSPKPQVKLFSIREKTAKSDLSPQNYSKKTDLRISLGTSPMGRVSPQSAAQTLSKEDKVQSVTQSAMLSPKVSLIKVSSNNMRLNTLEDKPSGLIKSNSPKSMVTRMSSKQKISEGGNQLLYNLSSRATFDSKTSGTSTPTLKKQSSIIKQFSLKKNVTEENPRSNPTPVGYTFDRNRLEYKLDVQRSSVNDVVYSPNLADLHNKNTKYSALRAQRTNHSPNHLLKVDLTKGYSYSKSHNKNAGRKEGSGDQVSPKSLLTKKLRVNTDDNERMKGPLRNVIDQSSSAKNKTQTEKFINWTVLKHRESSPTCSFNETSENNKSGSKNYARSQIKEVNNVPETYKLRNTGVGFRCKTFEI